MIVIILLTYNIFILFCQVCKTLMICSFDEITDVSHVGNRLKIFHPNHNVVVLE